MAPTISRRKDEYSIETGREAANSRAVVTESVTSGLFGHVLPSRQGQDRSG
jgi:hypothetical protein